MAPLPISSDTATPAKQISFDRLTAVLHPLLRNDFERAGAGRLELCQHGAHILSPNDF
jgi:hypothetical protein